jgi:hypothetical protein
VGVTAAYGYYAMFSTFTPGDDEGYLLLSLDQFRHGRPLYDSVFTQYGPMYYAVFDAVFSASRLGVTHDDGRLVTLVIWLVTAIVAAVAAARLAGSQVVGACSFVFAFGALNALTNEPMHPGGLLVLLLAAAAAFATSAQRRKVAAFGAGAALGGATFVKINVGGLGLIALAFALLVTAPAARQRAVAASSVLAVAALPFLLVLRDETNPLERRFALVVALSLLAVAISITGRRDAVAPATAAWAAWAAAGATAAALVATSVALAHGTSLGALVHGVLLDPLRRPPHTFPIYLPRWALPWGVAGVVAASAVRALPGASRFLSTRPAALGRLLAGIAIWVTVGLPYLPGTLPSTRGLALGLPLAWLALVDGRQLAAEARRVRTIVVSLAVAQALHAYPVAGSQIAFGSFLLVVVGAILVGDGLALLDLRLSPRVRRAAVAACVGLLLALSSATLADRRAAYAGNTRVSLHGATRLRLPADQAASLESVARALRVRCTAFVSMPGLDSFYLWTRKPPPTAANAPLWWYLLSREQQQAVVRVMDATPRPCGVVRPEVWRAARAWSGASASPLLRFMLEKLDVAERGGSYWLLEAPR